MNPEEQFQKKDWMPFLHLDLILRMIQEIIRNLQHTVVITIYNIQEAVFFHKEIDLNKFRFDLRRFIPIKISKNYALVLSGRVNSVLSFGGGIIPVYLIESIGYDNLIRGWNNFVFLGEDKFFGSLELRIPVIKPFYVKGSDHFIIRKLPIAKKFSYRYGMYATMFFDFGGVWGRKERIYDSQFKNGFGAGLNFLLPFDFVGRFDFAFRKLPTDKFKGQVILSLDASF